MYEVWCGMACAVIKIRIVGICLQKQSNLLLLNMIMFDYDL